MPINPKCKFRRMVAAMQQRLKHNHPLLTVKEWSERSGVNRTMVYRAGDVIKTRPLFRPVDQVVPETVGVTYNQAKRRPAPISYLPTKALRAAGFDGQRRLRLTVKPGCITITTYELTEKSLRAAGVAVPRVGQHKSEEPK